MKIFLTTFSLLITLFVAGQSLNDFTLRPVLISKYLKRLDSSNLGLKDTLLLEVNQDSKLDLSKTVNNIHKYVTKHKATYLVTHFSFNLIDDSTLQVVIELRTTERKKRLSFTQGPGQVTRSIVFGKNFMQTYNLTFDCEDRKWILNNTN